MSGNNYDMRSAYNARRRKRGRKILFKRIIGFLLTVGIITGVITGGVKIFKTVTLRQQLKNAQNIEMPDWVDVDLIHLHNSARTGTPLSAINNIVIHYVGNPGTSAKNNRDFFDKDDTEVSSHFLVGLDGEIIQCVPLSEKSSASNWRNKDTISIEVCHPDKTGKFNDATYQSVIKLTAWLCNEFGLNENDVIRHYDITGKECPKYYVDHEDKWEQFKQDVGVKLGEFKKQ